MIVQVNAERCFMEKRYLSGLEDLHYDVQNTDKVSEELKEDIRHHIISLRRVIEKLYKDI